MKKAIAAAIALAAATASLAGDGEEPYEFDRLYIGTAGNITLPQGGSHMRRRAGAALRAGYYMTEAWAVEAEAAWDEDCAGLAARALWHWWGYERLDPFFTFGARGWIGGGGQVGPSCGIGAFYHLTESLSLRLDADATLGIDTDTEALYTVSAGIQLSF